MTNEAATTLNDVTKLVKAYKPSDETKRLVQQAAITVLVGISGAGKDTIRRELLKTSAYQRFVTSTTRTPRHNEGVLEQDGVDYHFISLSDAARMLQNGEYVEGNIFSGNMYGTTVAEVKRVLASGKIALTDIDVNGVASYKKLSSSVIAIFVLPPNFDEWLRRLSSRYGAAGPDPADLQRRMHIAVDELEHALAQNYYHYVVNDSLEGAVKAVDNIAHNHDVFSKIDDELHAKAERLLADLRAHITHG